MRIETLEDLYLEQLKEIYSADQQALEAIQDRVQAANDGRLVCALNTAVGRLQSGTLVAYSGVIRPPVPIASGR